MFRLVIKAQTENLYKRMCRVHIRYANIIFIYIYIYITIKLVTFLFNYNYNYKNNKHVLNWG